MQVRSSWHGHHQVHMSQLFYPAKEQAGMTCGTKLQIANIFGPVHKLGTKLLLTCSPAQ